MKKAATPEEPKILTPEEEIVRLKEIIRSFEEDGMVALFFSLNRKANEMAAIINSSAITLTGNDKAFERFLTLIEKVDKLNVLLDKMRRDYLHLDEGQLKELEKTGVPLIEKRRKQK